MAYLFAGSPPSYAEERLSNHLGSLSTLPTQFPQSVSPTRANPVLDAALVDLSASRPLTVEKVKDVLQSLTRSTAEYGGDSDVDRLIEAEVLARAVTMVWKEVLQSLLEGALRLEEERSWWDMGLSSRKGVGIYLVQSTSLKRWPLAEE